MILRNNISKLENKNYTVLFDKDLDTYVLEELPSFTLPVKIYGSYTDEIALYLKNFKSRNTNLGILLTGLSGAGKTVMAKQLMITSKLPVLVISEPYSDTKFVNFINSISQEAVVFFDEFEKVYSDQKTQENLLTLFDGSGDSKKIFLLTTNDNNLNQFFNNRPGRIHYSKHFKTVEKEVLDEIIEDLLENKEYKKDVELVIHTLGTVGKDLVISYINEINLTGNSPKQVVKTMNINVPKQRYQFKAIIHNDTSYEGYISNHPFAFEVLHFEKWYNGFAYENDVATMSTQITNEKIILKDRQNNTFYFWRAESFDAIDNVIL